MRKSIAKDFWNFCYHKRGHTSKAFQTEDEVRCWSEKVEV